MEEETEEIMTRIEACPRGVYIGSEKEGGYELLLTPGIDSDLRQQEAAERAAHSAINTAIRRAYESSKGKEPDAKECIATLVIKLSVPKTEKPFTEAIPVSNLPHAAQHLVPRVAPTAEPPKYKIVVSSVVWTARWVCLPKDGIIEPPDDEGLTMSGTKTYLGNKVFDFGCPHPFKSNITVVSRQSQNPPHKRNTIEKMRNELTQMTRQIDAEVNRALFIELDQAIRALPKCPPECPPGEMSIMIGYPVPFSVTSKELITQVDKDGYDEKYQRIAIPTDVFNYVIHGEWSWSAQRACGKG